MEKKEKWQEDIENLLADNRTVDEWLMRDITHEQVHSSELEQIIRMCQMLANVFLGPCPTSEQEMGEVLVWSLAEAGCPREVINEFFRGVSRRDLSGLLEVIKKAQDDEDPPGDKES